MVIYILYRSNPKSTIQHPVRLNIRTMIKNLMKRYQRLLSILPIIILISCSQQTPANPPNITVSPTPKVVNQLGQELPISAVAITPKGTQIQLEVARTQKEQAMGLMYRPALPDNRGMLFDFPSPQPASFWMLNVPVPLDMVFLRKGIVQYIAASVPPCKKRPCPTYGPRVLIDQVIELRSGRAAELELKKGDKVIINSIKTE